MKHWSSETPLYNVPSNIIHNGQKLETIHLSISDEWINKMHPQNELLFNNKKGIKNQYILQGDEP
jgi:hypothetical protein